MNISQLPAQQLRAKITRMEALKGRLNACGEGVLAATIAPAVRAMRRELAIRA